MTLLGQKLKELRGETSLYEVGKDLGVASMTIRRFETGDRRPNLEILAKLANYYAASYEELCFLFYEDFYSQPPEREAVLKWAQQVITSPK